MVVNEFVQEYLFISIWDAWQLVTRGQTAGNGAGLHGHEATSNVMYSSLLALHAGWPRGRGHVKQTIRLASIAEELTRMANI